VYVSSDADPSPTLGYPPCLPGNSSVAEVIKFGFRRSRCDEPWTRQLPVLTNAVENPVRYLQGSLPVPDYTWVGWRHQLPWCQLSRRLEIAGLVPWASREDSAYFRGSLTNGRHRRRLDALSQSVDGKQMLSVHHVTSVFPNAATRASAIGSRESPERACAHRYLLSVPGFGYSSRLRSLLACGSAIIHVQPPGAYDEFYMPRLRHHEHLVIVRRVADILPTMRLLQANQSHARRLARNSRRFAMHELTYGHALEYLQALLTGLAARQAEPPTAGGAGFERVDTLADLERIALLCSSCNRSEGRGDVSRGKVHCAGDARAVHRCCSGFDCPTTELGCDR